MRGVRVAPNNGRVINCSESARKLEVMDVVPRAPDAPDPPKYNRADVCEWPRAVDPRRLSRAGERSVRSKIAPGNKAHTDSRAG